MAREIQKVVCYVVHDEHLLVFTHDDVPITKTGVQVTAGSIEPRESPEAAATRELFEETGRQGAVVRGIGTQKYDLRPTRDEIAERHYFHLRMENVDLAERWTAGEMNPSQGGTNATWTCWWMPITEAHVLAAGFGGMLGVLLEDPTAK